MLYHQLQNQGLAHAVPSTVIADLRQRFRDNSLRNLRLYGDLHHLLTALRQRDIPVVVLKGAFLAEAIYGNVALREMNDIDLLVPLGAIAEVIEIFTGRGYRPARPYSLETELSTNKHLPGLSRPHSPHYEIHWNLVLPGQPYSVEHDRFWERARPARIAGVDVLALAPADLLLHLCLHLSYGHQFAFGLRPAYDLAIAIRHYADELDWRLVVARTQTLGWQRGVYLTLRLAKDLVGAAVPQQILDQLRPEPCDAALVAMARGQIFTQRDLARSVPPNLAQLWRLAGGERLRYLCQRLFSTRIVARRYSLRLASLSVYLYYPRRILDLWRAYAKTSWKLLWQRKRHLTRLAERRVRLKDWLEENTASRP